MNLKKLKKFIIKKHIMAIFDKNEEMKIFLKCVEILQNQETSNKPDFIPISESDKALILEIKNIMRKEIFYFLNLD